MAGLIYSVARNLVKLGLMQQYAPPSSGFPNGVDISPMKVIGDTEKRGTEVHFLPDLEIFSNIDFHYEILAKRLRELSFLNNGVKIRLVDERNNK